MSTNGDAPRCKADEELFSSDVHSVPASTEHPDYVHAYPPGVIKLTKDNFENGTLVCSKNIVSEYQHAAVTLVFNLSISVGGAPVELNYPSPNNDFTARYSRTANGHSQHFKIETGKISLCRPTDDNYTGTFKITLVNLADAGSKVVLENGKFNVTGFAAKHE
ncbi:hypothetical protein [Pseudomonas lactucae]|uniref:Uncharacterized protein n=1 Tax=Pseudomonas lactucae TaxID=2813360 RepID=A0A9X0YBV2_9PSED|nr:hypothetical protein [Pseudomonas lactucae]MBN2976545.1 hypothetical protein [Pseudomonas lactucae]MBN2989204.1 hypothetical protein [Pseudomonas lactucae]